MIYTEKSIRNKTRILILGNLQGGARDAHFPSGNRETGNEVPVNFLREMAVFPGNFRVLTKFGLKMVQNNQNLTNLTK